jgi:hypothetical protein
MCDFPVELRPNFVRSIFSQVMSDVTAFLGMVASANQRVGRPTINLTVMMCKPEPKVALPIPHLIAPLRRRRIFLKAIAYRP